MMDTEIVLTLATPFVKKARGIITQSTASNIANAQLGDGFLQSMRKLPSGFYLFCKKLPNKHNS